MMSPVPVSEGRLKILVVDDEVDALEMCQRMLANRFEVLVARSGEAALELLNTHTDVAVIVTDQRMPGTSGIELLRESIRSAPNAVRVILSAFAETEDLLDAINVGNVHRYIIKPVTQETLVNTVDSALKDYSFMTELRERLKKT